jgi:hypothetical protein
MAESKTKTAANERQEASVKEQEKQAEKSAAAAKAVDTGKFTVVLRDEADSSVDSVSKLIAEQGGFVKSASKNKITVEVPEGSERNTDSQRQRVVAHLLNSPLVEGVE